MKSNLNLFSPFSPMAEIICVNSHQNRNHRTKDWLRLEGTGSPSNNLRIYTAYQLYVMSN